MSMSVHACSAWIFTTPSCVCVLCREFCASASKPGYTFPSHTLAGEHHVRYFFMSVGVFWGRGSEPPGAGSTDPNAIHVQSSISIVSLFKYHRSSHKYICAHESFLGVLM